MFEHVTELKNGWGFMFEHVTELKNGWVFHV